MLNFIWGTHVRQCLGTKYLQTERYIEIHKDKSSTDSPLETRGLKKEMVSKSWLSHHVNTVPKLSTYRPSDPGARLR